jgi:two-component system, cell cycle sensor histidine kinase and response regulator CckA
VQGANQRAEEALRQSEERFRAAFDYAAIGMALVAPNGRWIQVNRSLCDLVGYSAEELQSRTFQDITHPDDLDADLEYVRQMLACEIRYYHMEKRYLHKAGHIVWVLLSVSLVHDAAGNPLYFIAQIQDITGRKRAEQEKLLLERKLLEAQKLESLGVLAGGIAHDFNNLLTAVLGNASLIEMDVAPDSPFRAPLAQIQQAGERAADLCRQMLAYAGQGRFVLAKLDLNRLVQETTGLLQLSISKKVKLQLELAEQLPTIVADSTQMHQVVMNLVLNASEAIGDRPGVIRVTTGTQFANRAFLVSTCLSPNLPEREYVVLEVSDTGCGMQDDTRQKIFDPFFTTKFTGRGLGLAAVLGIIRSHKGAIKVESKPDQGSTFRVLLPTSQESGDERQRNAPARETWRGEGTVLVVDDEAWVCDVTSRMLKSLGFHVISARDGEDALTRFQESPDAFRLVLLDLTMPRLDGVETFRTLHLLRPELPVILMSGYSEQEASARFAGEGLAGFLAKPFRLTDLVDRVQGVWQPRPNGIGRKGDE